jgi:signal transduction histidine kinase
MTTTPGQKALPRRFWQTIQGKLILLLTLLLLPTLLIQVYVYNERFKALRAEHLQANLEVARAVAKAFHVFVQDVLHQELSLGLAFTSTQTLSDEDKSRILFKSQAGNPAIWHFFWDNPAGVVVAATGSQFIGMDISDREFYQEIVAGKDWVVSDLLLSKTTRQPSFTISRGIRNERGELLGIIVAGILPERLVEVLGIKRSEGGGVSLLDRKGMLVYRFPETKVSWEERDWLNYYPEQVKAVLDGKEIIAEVFARYSQKQRLVGFAPVSSIGWAAGAGRTQEVAMAAITSTLLPQTILLLILTVVVFGISLVLARKISTSVTQLRNYALLLGRGEKRDPPEVSGLVELNDLAVTLDSMAEEISEREARIRTLGEKAEKKAAEAISERNRLKAVMEALPVGMAILNERGGSLTNNPEFDRIWGGPRPEVSSVSDYAEYKAWWVRTGLPVQPEEWASARAVREGQTVIGQVMRIAKFDGDGGFIYNSASPVRDAEGVIVGSAVAIMDITEHKQMEEELRKSRDELELRVQERTDQLHAYMAKLEQSNQALQDFASIASHDLHEPLRKVATFADMLKQKCGASLGEQESNYLERILDANQRMRSLLSALLEYSRLTTKADPFTEVDLTEVVEGVLSDLEVSIQKTGGEVEVGDLPAVQADPTQMRQLFQNLIGNALKFHKEGERPVIKVSCKQEGDEYCQLVVEDNGIGFEEQYLEKIFAPFQRLHAHSEYEGTGMGLAICKKIVERHGGAITARSGSGRGSAFVITLPIKQIARSHPSIESV